MRLAGIVFCCSFAAGQTQPAGVTAEWDVRNQMATLSNDVRKLDPLLQYAAPEEWIQRGAPEAYVRQLNSARSSLESLIAATTLLARQPEKLPVALDAFFQMERMELLMTSLRDGIRKYQSGDLADMMNRAFAVNVVHRDRLRQHIRDLANLREQEFQIANEEAQRCRGTLTKQTQPEQRLPAKNRGRQPSPK
ncbi:MAG: hypothetical protein H7Y20_19250 [Bryobacteraceae bacterium]|nr:hypothetical protein [Bryobacteraceae bacterium]